MNKFVLALLCAIGLSAPATAFGQMTAVTASTLKIGSSTISSGTVCATAVDSNENPITVAVSGGGLWGIGSSCGVISAGAITSAVGGGTYSLPDEAIAGNAGFYYTFTVKDTSIGNPTSGQSFQLHKVPGVAGSTFALDHYVPITTVSTLPSFSFSTGSGAPVVGCSGKSFYQDNSTPTSPVLYSCGGDGAFHVITAGDGNGVDATITIGSTTTGAAGTQATVTNSGTTSDAVLHFTIPQGTQGTTGATGATGPAGAAATVSVGTVTTGAAGSSATVTNSGTSSEAILNFTIPQGVAGSGGGAVPTGTGFTHITSGVQDSAARLISPSDIAPDTTHNGGLVANRAVGGSDVLPADPSANGVIYTVENGAGVILYPDGSTKTVEVGPQTFSCQVAGPGDGLNTITAGTYPLSGCFNEFGTTLTITAVKCYTDAGTSTLSVTNSTGTALLTGPITCGPTLVAGTLNGSPTLTASDFAKFSFVAAGAVKQVTFVITGTRP